MSIGRLVALFLGIAFLPAAQSHHAFSATFDVDKPIELTGMVTKLEWQNPHTWFYMDVTDEHGKVASWAVELASPNLLMRNGWTRDSMKVGDVVRVDGYHAKDGSNTANAKAIVLTATGETLLTGPAGRSGR
ncbi:MAG TPA: DUF6152 family protein [Gammaproteobacteria bacterium]